MGLDALRQRLSLAMENLVTLQIVTVVAEQIDLPNPKSIASGKAIRTRIRLDQGDIVTEMHPDFVVDEKLGAVLQFHTERENNAQQIIQRNLDVLGSVKSKTAGGVVAGQVVRADVALDGGVTAERLQIIALPALGERPLLGMDVLGRLRWTQDAGVLRIELRRP